MASLFGLGFLKGAATTSLDRLEKRDEAEREMRKQELLAKVRLETARDLADYEDLLASRKVDKNLSSADYDSGEFVNRNMKGEEIGRRTLTQDEITARATEQAKDTLALENVRSQIEDRKSDQAYKRDSLAVQREGHDLQRQRIGLDKRALDAADAGGRNESGSYNVGSEIMRANEKTVADAISDGIPGEEIAKLAASAAANAKARQQGYNEATQYFIEGIRLLRSGVTSERGFDSDAAGSTINDRRNALGLQAWRPQSNKYLTTL